MTQADDKPWFPAKHYGWGWGLPIHWKGWLFLVGWLALLMLGTRQMVNLRHTYLVWVFIAFMIAVLIGVCLRKGEKPVWRWG